MNENFLGFNNFIWWVGVVEDREDPQTLGRVRVRILGTHTSDKNILPTADLPWAQVVHPVTSSGISGLGNSTFLVTGSWVFGFFRDGEARQEPVVLGTMPGLSTEYADTTKGFYDPNGTYPKELEPDTNRLAVNDTSSTTKESTSDSNSTPGLINPIPSILGVLGVEQSEEETENSNDKEHISLQTRKEQRITGIPTADFNAATGAGGSTLTADDGSTFDEPTTTYATVYPYNKVFESESGHIKEYDDTPDATRIHERHRSGTGYEIDHSGNQTTIIKGLHTELDNGHNHYINGNSNITVEGHSKLFINKSGSENNHYTIQIGAGANVNIQCDDGDINLVTTKGNVNINSGGDYNLKVQGDYNVEVQGSMSETVDGTKTSNTTGAVVHRGSTIDLNP